MSIRSAAASIASHRSLGSLTPLAEVGVFDFMNRSVHVCAHGVKRPVHSESGNFGTVRAMNYGPVIKAAREAAGYTQKELSHLTGIGRSDLSKLETGRATVNPEQYQALMRALRETLHPRDLLPAMGYDIAFPPGEGLNPGFTRDVLMGLEQLDAEGRRHLAQSLSGLLSTQRLRDRQGHT